MLKNGIFFEKLDVLMNDHWESLSTSPNFGSLEKEKFPH